MKSPIPDYLAEALAAVSVDSSGELPDYIPELATVAPNQLGAAFAMIDGAVYGAGDYETTFTIQSISKPFVYALALADRGFDAVLAKVGVEPSGEAFNELWAVGTPRRPTIQAVGQGLRLGCGVAERATQALQTARVFHTGYFMRSDALG